MTSPAKKVTLTFDNGPTPGVTERVLSDLRQRAIPATFFVIGQKLEVPAGRMIAEQARAEGHAIGNHTLTHGVPLGQIGDEARELSEINDAQLLLGDLSDERKLFRPNGRGRTGPHLLSHAAREQLIAGHYTVALWNVFVSDDATPIGWSDRAMAKIDTLDWAVVVIHDLPSGAMDSLPEFLDRCLDLGIRFVQDFPDECVPVRAGQPSDWLDQISMPPRLAGVGL